jgi:hypothetical protein
MSIGRKAIYRAHFDLASAAWAFVTTSTKLKHWNDVKAVDQPSLFQRQVSETITRETRKPPRTLIRIELYVYVHTDDHCGPADLLNDVIDALCDALADPFPGQPQTLGGLVEYARIEGTIETSEGTLGEQAVAIVPIEILVAG